MPPRLAQAATHRIVRGYHVFSHYLKGRVQRMSTETVPTADTGGLNEQVEAVVRETKALMAAQAAGRRARLLLLLVFIVFVGVVCYAFLGLGNKLLGPENRDALVKAAQ